MMIGTYNMQYNCRSHHLVTNDVENEKKVAKFETYKFEEPFLTLKPNETSIGRSQICRMTETSGVRCNPDLVENILLFDVTNPENNSLVVNEKEYVLIFEFENVKIATEDIFVDFLLNMDKNIIL